MVHADLVCAADNMNRIRCKDKIVRLSDELQDMVEPDYGLLELLVKYKLLVYAQKDEIKHQAGVRRRNALLFGSLPLDTADQEKYFYSCLDGTEQSHIRIYIECNGGKCIKSGTVTIAHAAPAVYMTPPQVEY